ncbi:MAG: transporter substrate-binding domain-containing protein [Paucibacter sp.]|nr:transporter substrate-binding domain-containing protein [Roseateles sp.]
MKRRELAGMAVAALLAPVQAQAQVPVPALQGYTENLPPLNYAGAAGTSGFSVELLRLMAGEVGLSLDIQVQPWIRAMRSAGEASNTVLFSLARLPEREALFQWVGPISERRIVIYRLKRRADIRFPGLEQLQGLQGLHGLRIGAVRESAAAKRLLALGLLPEVDIEWALDDASNLRKLLAGRMDLLVMLDWAAAWHLREHKLPFASVTEVAALDTSVSYWFGLHPHGDPAIRLRLQAALDRLKRDGRYAKLRTRYFD